MNAVSHYELLAALFDYPEADFLDHLAHARELVSGRYPSAAAHLASFAALLPGGGAPLGGAERGDLDDLQELFTRSFQVQAVTTLDVGYIAFGDDYKRAELLVNLNRELRDAGLDSGAELSDHLPNVLRLISRWTDDATMREFIELILCPALEMMIFEFRAERVEQRDALYRKHFKCLIATSQVRATMYRHALMAVLEVLRADFGVRPSEPPERTSDFLRSVRRELEIEARGAGKRPSGRM